MASSLSDALKTLTKNEITDLASRVMDLPSTTRWKKDLLVEYITQQAMANNVDGILQEAIVLKEAAKAEAREQKAREQQRRWVDARHARQVAQRTARLEDVQRQASNFMELPTPAEVKQCYRQFYDATGAEALASAVCAVCGREVLMRHCSKLSLAEIPNKNRLTPTHPHSAHTLYQGSLLEPAGVDGEVATLCSECLAELKTADTKPPKLSLANGLWVGAIPDVLAELTIPEQLLIALVYPRVYVFKLYPRLRGYKPAEESLQRAMRGTVSTFEMDTKGVVSMLEGNLMPRQLSVLASLISVTFVGSGKLPRNWLKKTFRVRRQRVADALKWLHDHNPRYYGDIIVSDERIALLPEDDLPESIESIVRHCEEEDVIDREHNGYVPAEEHTPDEDIAGEAGHDVASGEGQFNTITVTHQRARGLTHSPF